MPYHVWTNAFPLCWWAECCFLAEFLLHKAFGTPAFFHSQLYPRVNLQTPQLLSVLGVLTADFSITASFVPFSDSHEIKWVKIFSVFLVKMNLQGQRTFFTSRSRFAVLSWWSTGRTSLPVLFQPEKWLPREGCYAAAVTVESGPAQDLSSHT